MSASRPVLLALVLVLAPRLATPQQTAALTPEQMAVFLAKAEIVKEKTTSSGVTRPIRATLSDGVFTHDAQFQTVDQAKSVFTAGKASEVDFKDSYRFNIAGYRLAQMVGLQTVPDPERTQKQIYIMRVWDELIQNKDRNAGNIVWTKDWTMWLIDHTRAFRSGASLLKPAELLRVERTMFDKMKQLTEAEVSKTMKGILTPGEIRPMLKRRDAIVAHFEKLIAERGEVAVFFTLSPLAAR
jgi:hypothetical protein